MTDQDKMRRIIHHDYLKVCEMRAPLWLKSEIMTRALTLMPDVWRVVGITEDALNLFAKHDFKRVSGMGINRSHLVRRHDTYTKLLSERVEDFDTWYKIYWDSDKTVLATKSENATDNHSRIIPIDYKRGLFQTQGYAWRHRKVEQEFLRNLHKEHTQ